MAEPFHSRPSDSPGVLSRMARRSRAAAIGQLEALLAAAERLRDVTPADLEALSADCGVDVSKRLHTPRCNLYRRFFEYCLTDYSLSDGEVAELRHLQRLLNLSDADVARIQDRVARDVYGAAIQQVLDDGRLDEDEAVFLRELRADLALPEFRANQMYEEEARRTQQRVLSRVAPSSSFLAPAGATFEIQGASTGDLDGAIRAAIDEAAHALPELSWAELDRVRVQVESGRVVQCSVRMRIGTTEAPES